MREREPGEQGTGGKSVPGMAVAEEDGPLAVPLMELWNLYCAERDVRNLMANTEEVHPSA